MDYSQKISERGRKLIAQVLHQEMKARIPAGVPGFHF